MTRASKAKTISITPGLTKGYSDIVDHQIRTSYPGQAFFANSGPFGATCGECIYLGYWRQYRNKSGNLTKTVRTGGCEKYHQLTNTHGPVVPPHAAACRYFVRKSKEGK